MSESTNHRTFVVGDIHGCYDELMDLLDEVDLAETDRVIAVGDLIVKGPKNREVLDLFISDPRFSSVLGNHDLAVLSFLDKRDQRYTRPQKKTGKELEGEREKYLRFLASLPLYIDLKTHLIVHAGVRPGVALGLQDTSDLLELRTLGENPTRRRGTPWYKVYDGEKFVLFGHWPRKHPQRGPRALGLDTGCVYGNRLTAYLVETGEIFSVPAREPYSRGSKQLSRELAAPLPSDQTIPTPLSTESVHA
ncbi:MAG TPA: metallophosphoesterase family protein [Pyrinomonadaceae bacterium]|nr:metallophosphoesterase family protein [Pyrinomonadaceae bacterium]